MDESDTKQSALEKRAIDFIEELQLELNCEGFVKDEWIVNKLVDLQTRTIMQFISGGMTEVASKNENPTHLKTYKIKYDPLNHKFTPQTDNESYCICGFHFTSHKD